MGTSNWQNISYNIEIVGRINPKAILDFGVGFGRWGILYREFLEIWDDKNYSGKWTRTIDGIEVFPQYIKPYHNYFYSNLFITEGYAHLSQTEKNYDLIVFGDVIEHFDKEAAEKLLDIALKKSEYVLVNIPIGKNWAQGAINGNIYEVHKSIWYISDFSKYKYKKIKTFRDLMKKKFAVVLLSNHKIDLEKEYEVKYGKYYYLKSVLSNRLKLSKVVEKIIRFRKK